jgi:uncharacterized lipoprotein YmbA
MLIPRPGRRFVLSALPVAILAGCASSPTLTYTLSPVDGVPQGGRPRVIILRRVGIPGYLDRPQIVTYSAATQLDIAEFDRWGEPFDAMVGRVLAADLAQRLPGTAILSEEGEVGARPDMTIEIDLARFEATAGGEIVLEAQWRLVGGPAGTTPPRMERVATKRADDTTPSLANAMNEALGRFSDILAAAIR